MTKKDLEDILRRSIQNKRKKEITAHSNGQLLRISCARMWVETCEHRHEGPESDQILAQAR